ncbi:unnamed protein product [Calicophoron daubneyi]|uniref:Sugar phosphate exchanger 3 n=1 Tax=Calicophoron daubneyi TaxID=300641 RepID=A0AAV2TVQ3_CALDB
MTQLALGLRLLNRCLGPWNRTGGAIYICLISFLIYTSFNIARKPLSIVKPVMHGNCVEVAEREGKYIVAENETFCYWAPFDKDNYSSLFGTLDLVFLAAYAIGMYFTGHIGDRFHLRHFLTVTCLLTGLVTCVFGFGYYLKIHSFAFYAVVQLVAGICHSGAWPAVVACVGNWCGKTRRALIMGIWSTHSSVGCIVGSIMAGFFLRNGWGLSFVVPGILIAVVGVIIFFFLAPYPEEVGIQPPNTDVAKNDVNYAVQSDTNKNIGNKAKGTQGQAASSANVVAYGEVRNDAISIWSALRVPGVVEYSLCLFFCKLVSYTFLFWLPHYISEAGNLDPFVSAQLSTIFDFGGIIGAILAGFIMDQFSASASLCWVMLILGIPTLYLYRVYGLVSVSSCIGLLIPLGVFINGPYLLISTAISAELGIHQSLRSNARALSTVVGIVDATGSAGSAIGPLLCGVLRPFGWWAAFLMLMTSLLLAALFLSRLVLRDIQSCTQRRHE